MVILKSAVLWSFSFSSTVSIQVACCWSSNIYISEGCALRPESKYERAFTSVKHLVCAGIARVSSGKFWNDVFQAAAGHCYLNPVSIILSRQNRVWCGRHILSHRMKYDLLVYNCWFLWTACLPPHSEVQVPQWKGIHCRVRDILELRVGISHLMSSTSQLGLLLPWRLWWCVLLSIRITVWGLGFCGVQCAESLWDETGFCFKTSWVQSCWYRSVW